MGWLVGKLDWLIELVGWMGWLVGRIDWLG